MMMEVQSDNAPIEYKIRKAFPDNYELMLSVALCESGLNQNAISHTNDYGVFQINEYTWDTVANDLGLDYKNSIDDNIKMAKYIYENAGIESWVCFSEGLVV